MARLTDSASNDNADPLDGIPKRLLRLAQSRASDATFAALERTILDVSNEIVRSALEMALGSLGRDNDADLVQVGKLSYRRHQFGEVKYHSLCGPIVVGRWTYRLVGVRNGPTVVPLELRAGLIERATPALAYAVTQGYAKAPLRSVRQDLEAARREPPSRATMERMAKAIGSDVERAMTSIESRVRATEEVPNDAVAISLGLDRVSIPMEEENEDEDDRIVVRYRMGYVGTVALTNSRSEVVVSRKYAAPACDGAAGVVERMMRDVKNALGSNAELHVGVVQDGAPELWNTMNNAMQRTLAADRKWHRVIDMYHLMERVSRALEIVEPDERVRASLLRAWKRRLLRDDSAIATIARYFELDLPWLRSRRRRERQSLLACGLVPAEHMLLAFADEGAPLPPPPPPLRWSQDQAEQVSKLLWLYLIDPGMFRYARAARVGLHVGSGVTEGACKSLVAIRAKRSGQRWRPNGIRTVLNLRSLLQSDRFDSFWRRFARRYSPSVIAA